MFLVVPLKCEVCKDIIDRKIQNPRAIGLCKSCAKELLSIDDAIEFIEEWKYESIANISSSDELIRFEQAVVSLEERLNKLK